MNSDLEIAGDPLALPHLLPAPPAHPATVADFAGLIGALAADRAAWAPLVRYDPTLRWYHRLRTGPGYEMWLLSWLPGQGSGRHDHGRSSGVFGVLTGELTEHGHGTTGDGRAATGRAATEHGHGATGDGRGATGHGTRVLRTGAVRVFAPGYVHEVVNDGLEPVVSAHIYAPGLTEMPQHCSSRPGAARHPAQKSPA
ncbi:cysteine dioxygenase [Streptomyces qinglanensis]|uniref:Cysteine dioxygenase type I n=1 Tax=Streptomyces qinglanensis TaxID=943816 RepID=A0A1H9VHI0_9ACTN|nr:cysteine dioxygenase family protein [Streptomyces qinglanensis]SES21260.1 Cysteine dioxygenase type I [Streptomyces qinglanensis]